MRKLTPDEEHALAVLRERGPITPGLSAGWDPYALVREILDSLVKKKRATVEMTDDGPRYHASA